MNERTFIHTVQGEKCTAPKDRVRESPPANNLFIPFRHRTNRGHRLSFANLFTITNTLSCLEFIKIFTLTLSIYIEDK